MCTRKIDQWKVEVAGIGGSFKGRFRKSEDEQIVNTDDIKMSYSYSEWQKCNALCKLD